MLQKSAKDYVSLLFHSREQSHIFHLQVKGENALSIHLVLDDYYKTIPELIDSLVESYQGRFSTILTNYYLNPFENFKSKIQVITYFKNLLKQMDNFHTIVSHSELQNIVDEIKDLINTTIYKLENL